MMWCVAAQESGSEDNLDYKDGLHSPSQPRTYIPPKVMAMPYGKCPCWVGGSLMTSWPLAPSRGQPAHQFWEEWGEEAAPRSAQLTPEGAQR